MTATKYIAFILIRQLSTRHKHQSRYHQVDETHAPGRDNPFIQDARSLVFKFSVMTANPASTGKTPYSWPILLLVFAPTYFLSFLIPSHSLTCCFKIGIQSYSVARFLLAWFIVKVTGWPPEGMKKTFIEAINFSCHVNWFLVTLRINGGTETDESPQASGKEISI